MGSHVFAPGLGYGPIKMTPSREKLDALARLVGELDPSSP